MCFTKDTDALVAPRAVRVVKLLHKSDEGAFVSPVKKYPYHKDAENPEVKLSPDKEGHIFEGYHSYLNEQAILNLYRNFGFKSIKELQAKTPYFVGICEIPVGSVYFVGAHNEVVSNNLILRDIV